MKYLKILIADIFQKKIIYQALLSMIIIGGIPTVMFAETLGVAVDKTAVVINSKVGVKQEITIGIKNISNQSQKIEFSSKNYILKDNNELILSEDNFSNGLKDWIVSQDNNIKIQPNKKKNVSFTINIPKDATIGSHRGVILAETMSTSDNGVKIRGQIGVHVLINVTGDTNGSGYLKSFIAPLFTFGLVQYITVFKNTGNIHYVPEGKIIVSNVFTTKKVVYQYDKHFVFPDHEFSFFYNERIPSLFGLYKARVVFVNGNGQEQSLVKYIMGSYFPLLFIICVICIGWILWWILKNNKNK